MLCLLKKIIIISLQRSARVGKDTFNVLRLPLCLFKNNNVALCEEMETLIKNHKTKGNSKKRETKMEKEKEVLALFKKEGDNSLKSIKQASKILKQADQETKKK